MAEAVSDSKDPVKVRAGRIGATKRWGDREVVRLDELSGPQRRLVEALVRAARAEERRDTSPEAA